MLDFFSRWARAKPLNQPFPPKVSGDELVLMAFGLSFLKHSDTTIADLLFGLCTDVVPLELSSLLNLVTQYLAGIRPARILSPMLQIIHAIGSVTGRVPTLVCLLICVAFANTGQTQTFEIDNDHTSLVFAVSHTGLSYTYGRFNKCSGQITLSKTQEDQSFIFMIESESIDTNNELRDQYLKGPEFFDVNAFPKIEFRSTKLSNLDDDFTAEGTLEMHGQKKNITIQLTKIGIGKGTRGETRAGFFSKFSVRRSDFGIKSLKTIIGDEIAITLSFEGILKPQAGKQSGIEIEGSFRQAAGFGEEFGILEK